VDVTAVSNQNWNREVVAQTTHKPEVKENKEAGDAVKKPRKRRKKKELKSISAGKTGLARS